MSDHNDFGRGPAGAGDDAQDTGELLAAYLADDLDEVRARRLERRLEADPDLREQLDRIHDVVVELRRVDAVAVPQGLDERIRARVADEAGHVAEGAGEATGSRRPASARMSGRDTSRRGASVRSTGPSGVAVPWWRRPIAAVAALALLGVVGVSSLGVAMLGSGADDGSAAQDTAAMMADGAEEAARADGGAADGDAGAGEAATGEVEAFGFDEPEAEAAATAGPSGVVPVEVPDLDSPEERLAYLEDVQARREPRPDAGGGAADDDLSGEQQRAALVEHGLEASCAEILVPADRAAIELILTEVDGVPAAGAVAAADDGGGLTLVIVDRAGCEVLVEERLPA